MRIVRAFGQHIDLLPIVAISDLISDSKNEESRPHIVDYNVVRGDTVYVCDLVVQLRDTPVSLTARLRPRPETCAAAENWPVNSAGSYYHSGEYRTHLSKMREQAREDWLAIQKDYARLIKQWKKVRLVWTPDNCMTSEH